MRETVSGYRRQEEVGFTWDANVYSRLWDIRRGIIPTTGAMRPVSTSCLMEGNKVFVYGQQISLILLRSVFILWARADVAVEVSKLAALTMDLQHMFKHHHYNDASIFGHALDGNLHLLFAQSFADAAETTRFHRMMDELCHIVAVKYDGRQVFHLSCGLC